MILSRNTRALHRTERAEFLKTLQEVGPHAPTLCEGWQAQTLAGHIVSSEQRAGLPLAVSYPIWRVVSARTAGAFLARVQDTGDRWTAAAAARGWDWLLARLEAGPPKAFALRMIAEMRFIEEFVHHEDVRRANGHGPRRLDPQFVEGLVTGMLTIRRFAVFAQSRRDIAVTLPDGRTYNVGGDEPSVHVRGDAPEVVLWLAGRSAADVEVDGDVPAEALRV